LVSGCACQDLAEEPPNEPTPTDDQAVTCKCVVSGSGPGGIEEQKYDFEHEVCVPVEFEADPVAYCQSNAFRQFMTTAGLAVAESENSAACDIVNVAVTCEDPQDPEVRKSLVRPATSCGGECTNVICDSSNCSRDDLESGKCECTVAAACGGYSKAPLCTPSFEGGILPPGSSPLSFGLGGGGYKVLYSKPGAWLSGSTMTTSVDFDACFLVVCQHIKDEATAAVSGSFGLIGSECPGGSCTLGLKTRAQVAPFDLDLNGVHRITDMTIDVISTSDALRVGPDGRGTIPAGTLLMTAAGFDNDVRKVIRNQQNSLDVPFTVDWQTRTLRIEKLAVPFPGNEGKVTIDLYGQFESSFADVFLGGDADGDGVGDLEDNCPLVANPDQDAVPNPVVVLSHVAPSCAAPDLTPPAAEDVCFGRPVTVTNDAPASFPRGKTSVTWTVTDALGNSTTATQIVAVRPALLASEGISLTDRASLGGTATAVALGRTSNTIGNAATIFSLEAMGPVSVRDRARVLSSIRSGAGIAVGNQVSAPPGSLQPFLSLVFGSFPELTWQSFGIGSRVVHLEPDMHTAVGPGTFARIVAKSRSVLTLGQGDYYMDELQLDPESTLLLTGTTRLFVRSSVTLHGAMTPAGHSLILTYGGTGDLLIEHTFEGALHAPRAKVVLGAGKHVNFKGTVAARNIELRPDVAFTCDAR